MLVMELLGLSHEDLFSFCFFFKQDLEWTLYWVGVGTFALGSHYVVQVVLLP